MKLLIKLMCGVVLAILFGIQFEKAWEKEHNNKPELTLSGKPVPKDTYIFVCPTGYLWIIGTCIVMFMIKFGLSAGTGFAVSLLLNLTLFFCVFFAVMMILIPYLRRSISSRACATLWLCPMFMFYSWVLLDEGNCLGLFTVYVPRRVLVVILIVWLAGFIISYVWSLARHFAFRKRVMAASYKVTDEHVLDIWQEVCESIDYSRPTALIVSNYADSPFSMGRIRRTRCTVLPQKEYSDSELRFIFLHEAHHLQRWDVDTKVLLTILRCACWFNPMVWIATNMASQDLELSCDEIVAEQMSSEDRQAYAKLLLSSAGTQQGFTTCLSASAGVLRYRLKNVVQSKKRRLGKCAVMLTLFVSVLCFNFFSFTDSRGTLASYAVPENAEVSYRYLKSSSGSSQAVAEMSEADIVSLLETTTVEHYINAATLYIDEHAVCHVFVDAPSVLNGYRLVTFYDNYVTISDAEHVAAEDHIEVYRIIR